MRKRVIPALLLALLLAVPASAHSGDTDSSGGHLDNATGDYHYHHGYPAHEHYDVDGDGDIDCPYDFDDQTGANSGSSSGYSSSLQEWKARRQEIYDEGYDEGFDWGYELGERVGLSDGYDDGYSTGHSEGYAEGHADGYNEGRLAVQTPVCLAAAFIGALLLFLRYRRGKRHADEIESLRTQFAEDLSKLRTERDALIDEREHVKKDCQMQILQANDACRNTILQDAARNDAKITRIKHVARKEIQNCFVDYFDPQRRTAIQFPEDINFHDRGISQGLRTVERPFGDLTVYRTASGRRFHTQRGCCGAVEALCLYDARLDYMSGCSKCTDPVTSYADIPEWYRLYKLLLSGLGKPIFSPYERSPIAHELPNDLWGLTVKPVKEELSAKPCKGEIISEAELEAAALHLGVDICTALELLNKKRRESGLPPLIFEEWR